MFDYKAWILRVPKYLEYRKKIRNANTVTREIRESLSEELKKAKDETERQWACSEHSQQYDILWEPIFVIQSSRLVEHARELGIRVPEFPRRPEDEGETWNYSQYDAGWYLTKEATVRINNEITQVMRQRNDEVRKWITVFIALAALLLSIAGLLVKTKAPDPCPKNYYRSDSGECVFALKPGAVPPPALAPQQKPSPSKPLKP